MKKYLPSILIGLITVLFIFLSTMSAMHESLTYDEIVDFQEGRNAILQHTFDIDPYNPPLTREVGIVPYLFTGEFYTNPLFAQEHPLPGRFMMILLGAGVIISVYFLAKRYIDVEGALFASFLAGLEPTLLANSHYATMDIGVTLLFVISMLVVLTLLDRYSVKKLLLLSLIVGLGMASKITFIPFFATSAFIVCLVWNKFHINIHKKVFFHAGIFIVSIFFVLWSVYFFNTHVVIKERSDSSRVSEKLLSLAKSHHNSLLLHVIIAGKTMPVPLGDYLATLKNNTLRTTKPQTCFFLGSFYNTCLWYFLPINLFLKISLSIWILSITGTLFLWTSNKKKTLLYITIPLICVVASAILLRTQPLVRYVLPAYPFLIILSGASWIFWQKTLIRQLIFAGLVMLYIAGNINAYPHFLSYTQEFAGDEQYRILMDSNLDWGQSLPDITEYVQKQKIGTLHLSYFGRANGDLYGLKSDKPYGSYKENEICEFHTIKSSGKKETTFISISNWYDCGYYKIPVFKKPKEVVSDSFLLF